MYATLLLLPLLAPAQDTPDATEVMDAVYARFGSGEAIAAVKTRVFEGKMAIAPGAPGEPGMFREVIGAPGSAMVHSELPGWGSFQEGANCGTVWEINPMLAGASVKTGRPATTALRHYALLAHAPWREVYTGVEVAGTDTVDGRRIVRIAATPRPLIAGPEGILVVEAGDTTVDVGPPDVWYVDADTYELLRKDVTMAESAMGPMIAELRFADWKPVDGILYPHERTMKLAGIEFVQTLERVQHDPELEGDPFQAPQAVHDAVHGEPEELPDAAAIVIEETRPQPAAVIRVTVDAPELGKAMAVNLPKVMMYLTSIGAEVTGPPFSRYHSMGDRIDFECGMPVAEPITAKGDIVAVTLPGGTAVSAWHVGPYEQLGASHERIQAWIAKEEVEVSGPCWEVYWTDPGLEPDPAKWRTQLLFPCKQP